MTKHKHLYAEQEGKPLLNETLCWHTRDDFDQASSPLSSYTNTILEQIPSQTDLRAIQYT